jgi:hypothetical protein
LVNRLGFTIGFVAASSLLKMMPMVHLVWFFHGFMLLLITASLLYVYAKKIFHQTPSIAKES